MSEAKPMPAERRLEIYTRGLTYKTADGIYRLTPKQRRRVTQKASKTHKGRVTVP